MQINEQELAKAVSEALSSLANKLQDQGLPSYGYGPYDPKKIEVASEQYELTQLQRRGNNDWLDSTAAAGHLGYAIDTLRNARSTGLLGGIAAPPFVKRGSRVFYLRSTLDSWLAQFSEQASTSGRAA